MFRFSFNSLDWVPVVFVDKSHLEGLPVFPSADMEEYVPKSVAVLACTSMTVFYVAILYAPTLILRLPHPTSLNSFLIRRFVCAGISSIVSIFFCALILPMRRLEVSSILAVYGFRVDHLWHAVIFPISLTSLIYTGSLVSKFMSLLSSWNQYEVCGEGFLSEYTKIAFQRFLERMSAMASDVKAWRNYLVAPLTEELVFRACMIPLLLCGGFGTYKVILLSPIFFSLAHLNHFLELYCHQKYTFIKASMIVGLQLGYTVIFGCYASFLFMRTGHLLAAIVTHVFCNMMGLPVFSARNKGLTSIAFVSSNVAGSQSIVGDLLDYLNDPWTQFHATAEVKRQFIAAGCHLLNENDEWDLKTGGHYFCTRNMSSLVAFAMDENRFCYSSLLQKIEIVFAGSVATDSVIVFAGSVTGDSVIVFCWFCYSRFCSSSLLKQIKLPSESDPSTSRSILLSGSDPYYSSSIYFWFF
ncbi:hypothetical protein NE237_003835 [Protea cynaroides]|uniref:intramembrane prenyl-peptidase Rce1 n=1 Tax=Protea cynaroides TaxID=273540 RepID=A0A9Q0KHV2_9MAGN|nr:hypothetical protein NE237_003835 [Protea cynaroides]